MKKWFAKVLALPLWDKLNTSNWIFWNVKLSQLNFSNLFYTWQKTQAIEHTNSYNKQTHQLQIQQIQEKSWARDINGLTDCGLHPNLQLYWLWFGLLWHSEDDYKAPIFTEKSGCLILCLIYLWIGYILPTIVGCCSGGRLSNCIV